ncbi:MAG: 23S rRNA (guanosine(2251)-2'-O)-methyltransferase RlmB [Lachnospiraceae bacterium]|nr:23S rRNA (guanosine(2251)-2'-O)-methyltransferase RlmB [Lachnospiraceae bacterium]
MKDKHGENNRRERGQTAREREVDGLLLEGKNAVREALSAGLPIQRVWFLKNDEKGALKSIKTEIIARGIPYRETDRAALDRMSRTGHHQGVIAQAAAVPFASMDDIFARASSRGEDPFLILLDGVEDPHNVGAIIRTAEVLGAHGVVLTKDRCAPLSETVMRASAGALHHLPIVRVTNLVYTIEQLKKQSLWFVCADMDGAPAQELSLTGPVGLIVGNEGKGVSRLVREHCDLVATIPMKGKVSSLNASVAAGILAYEIVRQRSGKTKN